MANERMMTLTLSAGPALYRAENFHCGWPTFIYTPGWVKSPELGFDFWSTLGKPRFIVHSQIQPGLQFSLLFGELNQSQKVGYDSVRSTTRKQSQSGAGLVSTRHALALDFLSSPYLLSSHINFTHSDPSGRTSYLFLFLLKLLSPQLRNLHKRLR
jgi:hypothetical protein